MNRKIAFSLGGLLILCLAGLVAYLFIGSGSTTEKDEYVFTPPPLSDNPPMSGSYIDAIDQEVKARKGENGAP